MTPVDSCHRKEVSTLLLRKAKSLKGVLKPVIRPIWRPLVNIMVYIVLAFFIIMRSIKPARLLMVSEGRMGAFTARIDYYLREKSLNPRTHHKGIWLSIISDPCNEQLLTMFKRHMPIYHCNLFSRRILNHNMSPRHGFKNVLKGSDFIYRMPFPPIGDADCYDLPPVLSFTDSEETQGRELFERMGLTSNSWFVCFIARDDAYFYQRYPNRDHVSTSHRNSSISNYYEAMKYVTAKGGYAIRVGAAASQRLPDWGDPHIIDYTFDYRSDFGDIYLPAKCKFFVGGESGLNAVPLMFNVPVVDVNVFTMRVIPLNDYVHVLGLGKRDLFIPRPIYSREKERLLTFKEILSSDIRFFQETHKYSELGLQPWESSPGDILEAVQEMNERIDGDRVYSEEEEALQNQFRSLVQPRPKDFNQLARIGTGFLKSHSELLEE